MPIESLKQKSPKKILVIITRRIGDVLLATPLIHTLKTAWPMAEIDVLVFENTKDILSNHPDIHEVIPISNSASKIAELKQIMKLWNKYNLAISTLPSDRAAIYAWLSGQYSIGLLEDKPKQTWKKYIFNDWIIFDNINTHTINMSLKLAHLLGLTPRYDISVNWTTQDSDLVDNLLMTNSLDRSYAVLHIYPKFSYKMWSTTGWEDLIHWLNRQNIQVILTGSNDPVEMSYIHTLAKKFPSNLLNLAGKLNFAQTAYLLKGACVYIGPDTVTTHLAATCGTQTIALFGPTNPVKWGPWPKSYHSKESPWKMTAPFQRIGNVILLQGSGECVPCHHEGCDRHINSRSKCLDGLPASRVISAINTLLS